MFSIGPSSAVCFCGLSGCGKNLRSEFCGCCICGKSQALYFLGLIVRIVRRATSDDLESISLAQWHQQLEWKLEALVLTVCITAIVKCMNVKLGQAVISICACFGLDAYSLEKMDGVPDFTKALLGFV